MTAPSAEYGHYGLAGAPLRTLLRYAIALRLNRLGVGPLCWVARKMLGRPPAQIDSSGAP